MANRMIRRRQLEVLLEQPGGARALLDLYLQAIGDDTPMAVPDHAAMIEEILERERAKAPKRERDSED